MVYRGGPVLDIRRSAVRWCSVAAGRTKTDHRNEWSSKCFSGVPSLFLLVGVGRPFCPIVADNWCEATSRATAERGARDFFSAKECPRIRGLVMNEAASVVVISNGFPADSDPASHLSVDFENRNASMRCLIGYLRALWKFLECFWKQKSTLGHR